MGRTAPLQASFARGELSPRAQGRTDLPQYGVGLETCFNAVITPRGEFERRPGTRFVAATKNNGPACLINFEVSDEESYIIEAGAGYFRFFANRDRLFSGPGAVIEVATSYTAEQACALDWAQSADVLYLTHPDHPPRKLSRTTPTTFALEDLSFSNGPYGPLNQDIYCLVSHYSIGQRLVFVGCAPLVPGDVGRPIRIWTGSQWVWDKIAVVYNAAEAGIAQVGNINSDAPNFPFLSGWQLGAFGPGNYPAHVVFHEDRLVFANTPSQPQAMWMSRPGEYENFSPADSDGSVTDDHAITITLNDRQVNAINWVLSMDNALLAGTASGPWSVSAGNDPGGLTPSSVRAFRQNAASASAVRPVLARSSVLFAQRSRRKLLSLNPDTSFGRYVSPDLSVLSDHLLCEGITAIEYQEEPYGLVWCALDDGGLAALTFNPDEELYAWHRHRLGGGGQVISLRSVPEPKTLSGSDQRGDDLWFVVRREIAGQTVHQIEHLERFWSYKDDLTDACFVDAAASYAGSVVTGVGGAEHLEGAQVEGLADGWVEPGGTVAGGSLPLSRPASQVIIGHPYPTEARLLDLNSGALNGASVSKPRHLFEAYIRLWRSTGLFCGPDPNHLKEFHYRLRPSPAQQAVEPENALVRIARDEGGWERTTRFYWSQTWPLPLVVLSVALRLSTSDE